MKQYATIIISYRRPDLLRSLLQHVAEQSTQPSQVIVVDNSGNLDADVIAESPLANITTLVRRPENPGYSAAVNEARAAIAGTAITHVLVLTHDADVSPHLAAGLLDALDDPRTGAAAPLLLRRASDSSIVFSAGGRLSRYGRAWNTVTPASAAPYEVDWVDGAIVMYPVDALERVGWLDERYFLYFEDVDIAWRMRRDGLRTVVVPSIVAAQDPGAHPMYLGIRNMVLFADVAGITTGRSALAVLRRVAEESAYRVLHRRSPALVEAWRGWRDGRRGLTGHPPERRQRG